MLQYLNPEKLFAHKDVSATITENMNSNKLQ